MASGRSKIQSRGRWPFASALLLVAGVALAACQPEATHEAEAPQPPAGGEFADADDLVIVDCLLPGQVRQLGTRLTYLEPRRPMRTDRRDCEIRGGEYVAFDRADYDTALRIWMEQAVEGDVEAMTHVGEIHERGLGRAPDHAEAARWYRRAAEEGHRRARVNLANLYAQGLGVPEDAERARRLYARAAGMDPEELEVSATPEPPPLVPVAQPAGRAEDRREIEELRAALEEARAEQRALAERLEQREEVPDEVARERERLEDERRELDRLRAELEERREALAEREQAHQRRLAQLEERREALDQARDALEAQMALADAPSPAEVAEREAELEVRAAEIADLEQELEEEREALARERERRLAELDAELEERRAAFERELEARRDELAAEPEVDEAERAEQEQRLAELQAQVEELERQLAEQAEAAPVEVADAPTIRLLDPELPEEQTRGAPVVKVRGEVTTRTVAGRVESPAGLLSFTVNDRSIEPDERGAFRTEVDLGPTGTTVQLVAVDREGRRAERTFRLEHEVAETEVAEGPEASPVRPVVQDVAEAVDFGRYHALVIGIDDYEHLERLDMAVRDAEAVAEVLERRYGFEVTLLRDATKRDIFQALRHFRETLTERDNLLIYYAGHGVYEDINDLDRGYWQPADAEPHDDFFWIPTDEVVAQVDAMSAKQVMIVADSCFSGAFMRTRSAFARLRAGRSPEALVQWYERRADLRTRVVLTSGGLEPVLDAGGGGHSVFARAFMDVLEENDGILEANDLYREVAQRVRYAAQAVHIGGRAFEQTPRYARLRHSGDGELADFFFVPAIDEPGV